MSSKRMIIVDEIYDEFLGRYKEAVGRLRMGDPFDSETTLAPLSSQTAADNLRELVRKAIQHGATATLVGPEVPNQGAFVQPTNLTRRWR